MGMDLIPGRNDHDHESVSYNWSGWTWMRQFAHRHGIDTSEFDGLNDGRLIKGKTCKAIAAAIRANAEEYNEAFAGGSYGSDPAKAHADAWENSGGMEQW